MTDMMKKLMLILILGMVIAGPAAPIFKSVGLGSTAAYAADDDSQGDSAAQGEDGDLDLDGQ